ncbi:MAG TPA: Asp-tRNA(Asn)/Glu-tRNA(Gln) amidotransferase subunit GatC [Kofleriaceae bacterium]|jgi:aspartyl-tRNA(Asn)/glutamyl-tRNA(Gln) amidotransferase subunit C
MSSLTRKEVEEIAFLARLHLEADEVSAMQTELGAMIEHFKVIDGISCEGVEPMTHPIAIDLPLREDIVEPSMSTADALRGAPKVDGDLIVVPAIIPGAE